LHDESEGTCSKEEGMNLIYYGATPDILVEAHP
jgi:hypothetical protein